MDGERKSCTVRILSAIEYGKLPNDETERRLCELVEEEVNKRDSEADMGLITACQSLMWQLHTHGELPYNSHYDENKAKIDRRLRRNALISNTTKSVGRMLVAAAAVVLVVLGLRGDLHWKWLEHSDTLDQQQHIIAGNEIGVELIQSAIAESVDEGVIQFTEIDQLPETLSFIPIPVKLHEEWRFQQVVGTTTPEMVRLDIRYENSITERGLFYTVILFTSADDAYFSFEQSSTGKNVSIHDQEVYVGNNMERVYLCWTQGLVFVRITGDMGYSEGCAIIESILEEWLE